MLSLEQVVPMYTIGEKMLEWEHVQAEYEPQGPRLSNTGERERKAVIARRVVGHYVAVFVRSPTPSHTPPFQ